MNLQLLILNVFYHEVLISIMYRLKITCIFSKRFSINENSQTTRSRDSEARSIVEKAIGSRN